MTDASTALKILVVDDEKLICDFMQKFLTLKGHQVKITVDGYEAITWVKTERFDVVFLDLRMPKINGLELLKELRKDMPNAEYVMMTGYAVEEMMNEALKSGATTAIRKPFDLNEILEKIKTIREKKISGK